MYVVLYIIISLCALVIGILSWYIYRLRNEKQVTDKEYTLI